MALGLPAPVQHTGLGASRELGWAPPWLLVGQQVVLHLDGHLPQAQQHVDWCLWEPPSKTLDHSCTNLYPAMVCKESCALQTHLRQVRRAPQQSQAQGSSGRTLHAGPE